MHGLLLGFRGEVRNPSLIVLDNPIEELVAVIHPPGTQFFNQLVLSDNLRQQESRYLWKLAAELHNREATVLHHAMSHKLNKVNLDERLRSSSWTP
ncbi:hypothetical protein TNCV_1812271 [Trichonephila clavipes]|uniref:Uncharacterized protein n=1 Tax=Trichonephila clavipes TaxID=2585209 RepID=A0A8X6W7B9_TRICX|nr:hypothetical protein TNCV_1812271 [Trichonephila clavipes]